MRKLCLLFIVILSLFTGSSGSLASIQAQASTTLSMYGGKWTSVYPNSYFELMVTPSQEKENLVQIVLSRISPSSESKEQVLEVEAELATQESGSFSHVSYPQDGAVSTGSIQFRDQTISITYTLAGKIQAFVFNQQLLSLEEVMKELHNQPEQGISFKDVPADHWARKSIEWAYNQGIIVGYADQTFRPNQQVSEAEFITMFFRAFGTIPKGKGDHWADGVYQFAHEKNYPVQGLTNIKDRNIPLLREQVAKIIAASQGLDYSEQEAIQYLLDQGLASGVKANEPSIKNFQGKRTLTRAEAVQFIKNVKDKGLALSALKK